MNIRGVDFGDVFGVVSGALARPSSSSAVLSFLLNFFALWIFNGTARSMTPRYRPKGLSIGSIRSYPFGEARIHRLNQKNPRYGSPGHLYTDRAPSTCNAYDMTAPAAIPSYPYSRVPSDDYMTVYFMGYMLH